MTYDLPNDMDVLRPDREDLNNGAEIVAYYPFTKKSGIVLAHYHEPHPWVTWMISYNPTDDVWEAEIGHYHETEGEAWDCFAARCALDTNGVH